MNKEKLRWCVEKKEGINLVEPRPHLSQAYMSEAEDTLRNMFLTKGKWKLILGYYSCYNALYSLLMLCGIKSEIHDCTIELMDLFDFDKKDINMLRELKDQRILNQYYLKHIILKDKNSISSFVLECKGIIKDLSPVKISEIRRFLKDLY